MKSQIRKYMKESSESFSDPKMQKVKDISDIWKHWWRDDGVKYYNAGGTQFTYAYPTTDKGTQDNHLRGYWQYMPSAKDVGSSPEEHRANKKKAQQMLSDDKKYVMGIYKVYNSKFNKHPETGEYLNDIKTVVDGVQKANHAANSITRQQQYASILGDRKLPSSSDFETNLKNAWTAMKDELKNSKKKNLKESHPFHTKAQFKLTRRKNLKGSPGDTKVDKVLKAYELIDSNVKEYDALNVDDIEENGLLDDALAGVGFFLIKPENSPFVYVSQTIDNENTWDIGVINSDDVDDTWETVSNEEALSFIKAIEPALKKSKAKVVTDGTLTNKSYTELIKLLSSNESLNESEIGDAMNWLMRVGNEVNMLQHDVYPENFYHEKEKESSFGDTFFMFDTDYIEDDSSYNDRTQSRKMASLLNGAGYEAYSFRDSDSGTYGVGVNMEQESENLNESVDRDAMNWLMRTGDETNMLQHDVYPENFYPVPDRTTEDSYVFEFDVEAVDEDDDVTQDGPHTSRKIAKILQNNGYDAYSLVRQSRTGENFIGFGVDNPGQKNINESRKTDSVSYLAESVGRFLTEDADPETKLGYLLDELGYESSDFDYTRTDEYLGMIFSTELSGKELQELVARLNEHGEEADIVTEGGDQCLWLSK